MRTRSFEGTCLWHLSSVSPSHPISSRGFATNTRYRDRLIRWWYADMDSFFQRCSVETSLNYPRNIFPQACFVSNSRLSLPRSYFLAKEDFSCEKMPLQSSADFIYFKSNGGRNFPFIMSTSIYGSTEMLLSFL